MSAQPGQVALQRRAGHDQQERGLREARDRQVALDAAALVQHLGVDDAARRARRRRWRRSAAAPPPRRGPRRGSCRRRSCRRARRRCGPPCARRAGCRTSSAASRHSGSRAPGPSRREPVGALPARHLAEHGAARLEVLVQRRAADAARRRRLAIGEVVGIEQAERLGYARLADSGGCAGRAARGGCRRPKGRRAARRRRSIAPAPCRRRPTRRCRSSCSRPPRSSRRAPAPRRDSSGRRG